MCGENLFFLKISLSSTLWTNLTALPHAWGPVFYKYQYIQMFNIIEQLVFYSRIRWLISTETRIICSDSWLRISRKLQKKRIQIAVHCCYHTQVHIYIYEYMMNNDRERDKQMRMDICSHTIQALLHVNRLNFIHFCAIQINRRNLEIWVFFLLISRNNSKTEVHSKSQIHAKKIQ